MTRKSLHPISARAQYIQQAHPGLDADACVALAALERRGVDVDAFLAANPINPGEAAALALREEAGTAERPAGTNDLLAAILDEVRAIRAMMEER